MDPNSFISAVKKFVRDAAIEDTYENVIDPPGRNPRRIDKVIAKWVASLSETEKKYIQHIIIDAVDNGLFGIMCAFDGVRKITEEQGDFILLFGDEQKRTHINDSDEYDFLHDIFQSYRFED